MIVLLLVAFLACLVRRRRAIAATDRVSMPGFELQRQRLQQRYLYQRLPNHFHRFISDRVVPGFEHQRQQRYPYQIAVLLLISEKVGHDINRVNFQPQDIN